MTNGRRRTGEHAVQEESAVVIRLPSVESLTTQLPRSTGRCRSGARWCVYGL